MFVKNLKQRFIALFIHLLLSLMLLGIALYFVYGIWYPSPLDVAVGVTAIYLLLLAVDLILGPLLTFIVYKEDKKKLKFDMAVILIVQISAFLFGLHTVAQGRPVWQVFVVDDIELVSPTDIRKTADYHMPTEFAPSIFAKPQWVAAVYSDNPVKREEQREGEMFEGINMSTRPETYQPLNYKAEAILKKLKPIQELQKFNANNMDIDKVLAQFPQAIGWLPVKAPEQDMVALFDAHGKPLKIVDLRPWD